MVIEVHKQYTRSTRKCVLLSAYGKVLGTKICPICLQPLRFPLDYNRKRDDARRFSYGKERRIRVARINQALDCNKPTIRTEGT